ncbi:menaquinone biosynthesis family protein [Helicobacter ailurogastricus]|uniref:menaquinone biosynthesis family protein n=1 Tax=Helicobacter ailurogastricus TaxID=1578720 RepID=UPI000CF025C6|nr:menaquinone biosynthesis family protein [Helicobacter ailurogastricus]GLH58255.1 Succinyl-CoA ligase [ADP-forming] subunit alpha [Helicobacter ailurogastricus]GLH59127.1 Succinyl-CoA ligase [ADP-forming] subunit alpha [Helicobacter ailurogastricus]GMB90104.1 Succinyl-CoA ligase [ADP-forming] subunit alpha [Helicobacter ailurogastricus]GMB91690.1 Succinyl-CoA ligase [ADP-forming] subunit alpha [Helicobacter ailurogastricus]
MLSIAHSPDADDIFMFYALAFGWVNFPKPFTHHALDIETLNEQALKGTHAISAISFGLYPLIKDHYALLQPATSFGQGYGPKLVRRKDKPLKKNFKVALSGRYTTNALLFRLYYPQARVVYKNFLEIEKAVLSGEVDGGVLIHESILDFHPDLVVEKEIWEVWCELSGSHLPLPLGGMALRRSIPLTQAIHMQKALTQAIVIALKHQDLLADMLLERHLVRVNKTHLNTYLSMYANENSCALSAEQMAGIDALFALGFKHGFYPEPITCQDHLIPDLYENLRFS